MTHDELLAKIEASGFVQGEDYVWSLDGQAVKKTNAALRAVVELHKPSEAWGDTHCGFCFDLAWEPSGLQMDEADFTYPCPTIQAIEKVLSSQP